MKVLSLEQQKLATLCNIEGFESLDRPLEATALDSVSPAICMTEGCSYTCEMAFEVALDSDGPDRAGR
jgi:hypothetical protein